MCLLVFCENTKIIDATSGLNFLEFSLTEFPIILTDSLNLIPNFIQLSIVKQYRKLK